MPEKALTEHFLTNFVAVQNPFARRERLPVQKWLKLVPDDELG